MIKYNFTDGYDGYVDGYYNLMDGYNSSFGEIESHQSIYNIGPRQVYEHQLNVKLTEEDMKNIFEINKTFFENEASNSMLGRILIRKGITFFLSKNK